jgi:hypothetical protein
MAITCIFLRFDALKAAVAKWVAPNVAQLKAKPDCCAPEMDDGPSDPLTSAFGPNLNR